MANPIAQVCASMLADLDDIAARALRCIRSEVPAYEALDESTHHEAVVVQFRGILTGLAGGRGPSAAESEAAFRLGRARAHQGLTVQAVISAYHVGYRLVWETLRARVTERGADADPELLQRVDTVWSWVEVAAGAAADGFGDATRLEDQTRAAAARRLFAVLLAQDPAGDSAVDAAREASYDPTGGFQAWMADSGELGLAELARLSRDLGRVRAAGPALASVEQGRLLVLAQPQDDTAERSVSDIVRSHAPAASIGVGVRRSGIPGAQQSVRDAAEALRYLERTGGTGSSCRFEDAWLSILTVDAPGRVPGLETGITLARERPDLAATAWAHLARRLSFRKTAQVLHVHPNSVRYRLERWEALTGWGFDTAEDRARTRLAIEASGWSRGHLI